MTSPIDKDSPITPPSTPKTFRLPPLNIPPTQTQCYGCKSFFCEGREAASLSPDKVYVCALCALKMHYGFEDESSFALPPVAKPNCAKNIDFQAEVLSIVPFTLKEMVDKAFKEQKDK